MTNNGRLSPIRRNANLNRYLQNPAISTCFRVSWTPRTGTVLALWGHGTGMVPRWYRDGTGMVPRWYPDGTQMVPRWHPDGTQMAPRWHPDGTQMAPRWHPDGTQMAPRWYHRNTPQAPLKCRLLRNPPSSSSLSRGKRCPNTPSFFRPISGPPSAPLLARGLSDAELVTPALKRGGLAQWGESRGGNTLLLTSLPAAMFCPAKCE